MRVLVKLLDTVVGSRVSRMRGNLSDLAGGLALQECGGEVPPKRRRIRVKTRDPSFGAHPGCGDRVRADGSQKDSKAPCKRRRIMVKSSDALGEVLVAPDSGGRFRGSRQGGSKRARSEEPITSDPGYNDGLHWPG